MLYILCNFCVGLDIKKSIVKIGNSSKKVSALFNKEVKIEWVKETLIQYKSIEPCNFNNDLNFWIEYIEYVDKKASSFRYKYC